MNPLEASLKRKIAQMLIVATPPIKDQKKMFKIIESYINLGISGLMLGIGGRFKFAQKEKVTDIKKLQRFVFKLKKLDQSLFLAIDGEGGHDFNLFENAVSLKPAREYGLQFEKEGSIQEFENDVKNYVKIIRWCGINMNFAPVLDVAQLRYKGYMSESGRSFSDKKKVVNKLSSIFIREMQKNSIIAVGKHFPGYGLLDENPHFHLRMQKNIAGSKNNNLTKSTFSNAIKKDKIIGIMKGHVLSFLDNKVPATLSLNVENYLRKNLGFNGLSITDELFMGALNEYYKGLDKDATKRIVEAAKCNDLLLISYPKEQGPDGKLRKLVRKHDHFQRLLDAVYDAVLKGHIPEQKINESYERIIKYKRALGLI